MAKKNEEDDSEKPKSKHQDNFHVSGPRNLNRPTWRDIVNSNWKDEKYKRTVIACFIQAVYLLELDRQEKREGEAALAPEWWKPFKYKVVETLVDKRDGSIFGATLEWDTSAALSDLLVIRPRKAPKAIIALRGTLLKTPTIRRDIEDDLRILTMENLRGSCRFRKALEAVNKDESLQQKKHINSEVNHLAAKLFVMSKGPRKFLEAHGLQQWWSSDSELQLALNNSKLIQRQLSSLYSAPPPPQLNP